MLTSRLEILVLNVVIDAAEHTKRAQELGRVLLVIVSIVPKADIGDKGKRTLNV